jgi:8-oxo-dGTP pyrophosphatase MutT (NUDIX family)
VRDDDPDGDRWEGIYGPDVEVVPEEVYVAEVPAGAEPLLSLYEHDDFRWCSFEEALELLKWDNNRDALVAARTLIQAKPMPGHTP